MRIYQRGNGIYEVVLPEKLKQLLMDRISTKPLGTRPPRGKLMQCLRRCNSENGNVDLNYWRLAFADDFTFWNDLIGLWAHMDEDGDLSRLFLPRCARGEAVEYEQIKMENA